MIRQNSEQGAFLARTGGEEFAIILQNSNEAYLMNAAERIRGVIEKLRMRNGAEDVAITMSFGVALSQHADSPSGLYEAADAALYRSKNAGRNTSTIFSSAEDATSTNRYRIYGG